MPRLRISLDNNVNDKVQNFYLRDDKATKVPGTNYYNFTALTGKIPWVTRYYGRKGDGTFVKKMFCANQTSIHMGNDVTGALTEVHTGLSENTNPTDVIMQVAGESRMYFFNGVDTPIYYEGNDSGSFNDSVITLKPVQGVVKNDRLWCFEDKSSILHYSETLDPEDFASGGTITVGNSKDSFIRALIILGDYLYIFKNDSIWALSGNTAATFTLRELVPHTGLLATKAIAHVNTGVLFVSQQDKQVYEFNGSWNIKQLTGDTFNFNLEENLDLTETDTIACIWDRRNNLFRLSYNNTAGDEDYNNYEVIAPADELGKDGKMKWSETYGARISHYSMWDRQGDNTLVTGRSDTGRVMYHNRGQDWDEMGMTCILRTDDIIPKKADGFNVKFNSFYIMGTPSNGTITVRSYLNSRITGQGTRASQSLDDTGESTTLESITIKDQADFHNWIPTLTGSNLGASIAFELYDATAGKEIEIENIILDYTIKSRVKNDLVG